MEVEGHLILSSVFHILLLPPRNHPSSRPSPHDLTSAAVDGRYTYNIDRETGMVLLGHCIDRETRMVLVGRSIDRETGMVLLAHRIDRETEMILLGHLSDRPNPQYLDYGAELESTFIFVLDLDIMLQ